MTLEYMQENEQKIPYYYFNYQNRPFYKYLHRHKRMIFADGERLNEYFARETFGQYDEDNENYAFSRATLFIIHYFSEGDLELKDLDNIDYKPMIDAIRRLNIIEDDTWDHLSLSLLGDVDVSERIAAYLVPSAYVRQFIDQKLSDYYIQTPCQIMVKKENENNLNVHV